MWAGGVLAFRHAGPTRAEGSCLYGCHPPLIRPTQRLTRPNRGRIVGGSMTEKKWCLLCLRHIKIQQAAESMAGPCPVSFSALRPSGRKKWVWASARKTRLAASGKPNALLAPSKGRAIHLSPYLSEHAMLIPIPLCFSGNADRPARKRHTRQKNGAPALSADAPLITRSPLHVLSG